MLFPTDQRGAIWPSINAFHVDPRSIGYGALSRVFRVQDRRTNEQFAIKALNLRAMDPGDQRNVVRELDAYRYLRHPLITRYYDHIIEGGIIYIVLELVRGGSLFHYIRTSPGPSSAMIRRVYAQCLEALDYVHRQGFIFRDVKPENILLDDAFNIRLCDFGWACRVDDVVACAEIAGTYAYMSPEALLGLRQTPASDVWALGVLLYECFLRREPFPGADAAEMLELLRVRQLSFECEKEIPEDAADLIVRILRMVDENRPTVAALRAHRFISPRGVDPGALEQSAVSAPDNSSLRVQQPDPAWMELGVPAPPA